MSPEIASACQQEIEDLHRFFQGWFSDGDPQLTLTRLSGVLAEGFELIDPDGGRSTRQVLLDRLEAARGAHSSDLRIWIEDMRVRRLDEHGQLLMATYEEWQETGGDRRGRLSSALFRARADAPNGLEWLHVHEVWLTA